MVLVEGEKLISEAVHAGMQALSLWSHDAHSFRFPCPNYQVPPSLYEALSPTRAGQAPLAVFAAPELAAATSAVLVQGRFLLLDRIQDPGNGGALVRAAVAFGFSGVIWRKPCVYPYHHASIRASAGAVFHVPHWLLDNEDLPTALPFIGAAGEEGATSLEHFTWPKSFVLAMGNEGQGLDPALRSRLDSRVKIPISTVESLNVAGAAHILMYDAAMRGAG